jgi:L-lysine exporter family protein LysE/ArgO
VKQNLVQLLWRQVQNKITRMELFISGFLLSISLCMDLGIVNVAIIKTGIEKGFIQSLNIGLGSSFGDLAYAIFSLYGISLIIKFLIVRWILWIAGTLILLYFCYNMIVQIFKQIEYANSDVSRVVKNNSNFKFFINGFGLALSSPTAILWFATIGGSMIAAQRLERDYDIILFLGGFFTSSLVWSIVLSYISYKGGQLMKNRIKKIFSILSALIFLILAIYVFLDGYKTLIN